MHTTEEKRKWESAPMNIIQAYMSKFTFILNNSILECQSPICQTSRE